MKLRDGWQVARFDSDSATLHAPDGAIVNITTSERDGKYVATEIRIFAVNGATTSHLRAPVRQYLDILQSSIKTVDPDNSKAGRAATEYIKFIKANTGAGSREFAVHMGVPMKTAQTWLTDARKKGMLPKVSSGRPMYRKPTGLPKHPGG